MSRFEPLSPHDFELFVADLLGADRNRRYETFARGADGGVDVRHVDASGGLDVIQCKHYERSTFSNLDAAAKAEATKLADLSPVPDEYTFATSKSLTAANKTTLRGRLQPWVTTDQHILSGEDLTALLNEYPEVERRHVKLWMTGATQLAALINAGTLHRSAHLVAEIEEAMPRFVQGAAFREAARRLRGEHALVIAGAPGIGKTTLARMLVADAVMDGYEPIEVSTDIEQAWDLHDPAKKQIFLYDDFLGRIALADRFGKNEDTRLLKFLDLAGRGDSKTRFVLTTREYILRQAARVYERIDQSSIPTSRFLLTLPSYSQLDRARILCNHVYASTRIDAEMCSALVAGQNYLRIIRHPNYNPRTVEWITGLGGRWDQDRAKHDFVEFAVSTLNHPELIWQHAFDNELDAHSRILLLSLVTLPRRVPYRVLEAAFERACAEAGESIAGAAFDRALHALDDSMISTEAQHGQIVVEPFDPSILDFAADVLKLSPGDASHIARSVVFHEQAGWLYRVLTSGSGGVRDDIRALIVEALVASFDTPGLVVVRVAVGANTYIARPAGTTDYEERLRSLIPVVEQHVAYFEWWRERFSSRVEAWARGEGEAASALRLYAGYLRGAPELEIDVGTADVGEALKVLIRGSLYTPQEFDWLAELFELCPECFHYGEWAEIQGTFDSWLDDELHHAVTDMADENDMRQIRDVVDRLGLETEDDRLDEAERLLHDVLEARRVEDPDEEDPDFRDARRASSSEADEIRAMFEDLVPRAPDE